MPPITAAGGARRLAHAPVWAAGALAALCLLLLTLAALLAGATQAAPGYRLRADVEGDLRALVRFRGLERNATEAYRWSGPAFGVYLYGFDGRPAIVELRLAAPRPPGAALPSVAASAAGVSLGSFSMGPGWRRYRILAPTAAAGETALVLRTAPYVPEGDPRELGMAMTNVAVAPTAGRPALPPPVRSLYLLSLPLIVWLLLDRLGARPALALGAGSAAALAVGLAAARPSEAGYLLPTVLWPWWPALPLAGLALAPQIGGGLRRAGDWAAARPAVGWAGLALALASLFAIRAGLPAPIGLAGLALGAWAGLGLAPVGEAAPANDAGLPWWPILPIVGLALALRLVNLDGQPAGLWRDESRHGLQALQIWSDPSYRPVYVAEGADLPALLFYLMAPVVGLLGPQVWSDRLVSAVIGGLTPLALLWAGAPLAGRRPALIAAALLAWASWGLSMSRWAFPATLDHLLTLTAVGLAWRGLDQEAGGGRREAGGRPSAPRLPPPASNWVRVPLMALAGLCAGLATYAYHTGRVAPIALALVVLIRLGRSPAAWRRALPGLAVACAVGLLTMAPLLSYIARDYDDYNRRVSAVSVLSSNYLDVHTPLGLLLDNGARYLLMWHVRGEPNGRHHLPDVPMLDPAMGLLLLLGLALALRAPRRPGRLAILAIPAVYMVPAIFSSDAPHAMRALGMLAPACLLAALAIEALLLRPGRRARLGVAAALLAFSLGFNTWLYFGAMRVEPRVYGEFDLLETALGRAARAAATSADPALRAVRVYLPQRLYGEDTVRFLTYGLPTYAYSGDPLPADGPALVLLPADASDAAQAAALAALGPGAAPIGHVPDYPGTARPIILAFGRGEEASRLLAGIWP